MNTRGFVEKSAISKEPRQLKRMIQTPERESKKEEIIRVKGEARLKQSS